MDNIFKKFITLCLLNIILTCSAYADSKKIDEKIKAATLQGLKKDEIKLFLENNAIIMEDERGDGEVTYIFDEKNYTRYKDYLKLSTGAWRFSKLGALRIFNEDVKMTWKIKLSDKENLINIKAKYDPIGKLYQFSYMPKDEYLNKLKDYELKIQNEKKLKADEKKRKADERKKKRRRTKTGSSKV